LVQMIVGAPLLIAYITPRARRTVAAALGIRVAAVCFDKTQERASYYRKYRA